MNVTRVVKFQPDHAGINLRLWTDDERGQHLAVSEMRITASMLAIWWVQVREEQDRYQQPPLDFDV